MFNFNKKKESKKLNIRKNTQQKENSKNRKIDKFDHSFIPPRNIRPKVRTNFSSQHVNTDHKIPKNFFDSIFDFRFNHDKRIFYVFIFLLIIGIIAVYSSSIIYAYNNFDNKLHYVFSQLKFIFIGSIVFAFLYFIKLEIITKFWYFPFFISLGLLIYLTVMVALGKTEEVNGAGRWLTIGNLKFQPSEFIKLSFVIFTAVFLSRRKTHYKDFREYFLTNLFPYSIWLFGIIALILIGSNLSTAMVIGFIGITFYGVAITNSYHRKGFFVLVLTIILGGISFIVYESYRANRLNVFLTYWRTNDTAVLEDGVWRRDNLSYQFNQSMISLGSGGINGVGLGQSSGKFYYSQTTASDDSIIGIIGEELGYIFVVFILSLYLYLVLRGTNIAKQFVDKPIYFYTVIGCVSWIGFQAFVHVAANIGIIPLTGQTLPFISLGGSSMISLFGCMGLLLNATKQLNNSSNHKLFIRPDKRSSR